MNKRGQIYIIVSLIIGLIIFVLTIKSNFVNLTPTNDDYREISQNYNHESSQFIASKIKLSSGKPGADEISQQIFSFSKDFTEYAKSINPDFGLIYFLNYENNLLIGNFFDKNIFISINNQEYIEIVGCYSINSATINSGQGPGNNIEVSTTQGNYNEDACRKVIPISTQINNFNLKIKGEDELEYNIKFISEQPEVILISRENVIQQNEVTERKVYLKDYQVTGIKK